NGAAPYGFIIQRYSSTRNVNFEVFAPKIQTLDEQVHARSLANLADAPDAVTVAALDVHSPYPQESYSSEGPANGPGGTAGGGTPTPPATVGPIHGKAYLPLIQKALPSPTPAPGPTPGF